MISQTTSRAGSCMVPLLDIKLYYRNPTAFVEELRSACHNVGFFLLQHDIPQGIPQRQLDETRAFFQHPVEEKQEISYEDSPSFRGYMRLGVENTAGAVDLREQIEYAVEYKSAIQDPKYRKAWPVYERLKSDRNLWPSFQPTLQTTTEKYVSHVCRIADCIREALCLALGVPKNSLDRLFGTDCQNKNNKDAKNQNAKGEQPHWVLKLVSYPVVKHASQAKSFGVGGHTDTNFLTLVLQDDIGGLQVFSDEQWMDVPKDLGPGVLVCNLGEQAEILSRGYFLATPHRVLANISGKRERISIPLFYNPMLSSTIEPLVGEDHHSKLKWERGERKKYWRRENNSMLASVGDNTFKSLARSHLQVFQRHHGDLKLLEDGRIVRRNDES